MKAQGPVADVLADEVLAARGYRARRRKLSSVTAQFSPGLSDRFAALSSRAVRNDPGEAAQCARLAASVARELDDAPRLVAAFHALGEAAVVQGRFLVAVRTLDRAAAIAQEHNATALLPDLELARLYPLAHLGRYDEAREAAQRALELCKRTHDRRGTIRAHMALADLAFRLDRPKDALRHYSRIDGLLEDRTPPRFRAVLAANRANALEARNRFRAATRHFDLARRLLADTDFEHSLAQVEYNAAYAALLRGRYTEALHGYARTAEIFERLKDERHLALADLERAEIHVHLNLPKEARTLAARAERKFKTLGVRKEAAQAAQVAAGAAELLGRGPEAEAFLRRAEEAFGSLGLFERQLSCLVQRGRIAVADRRIGDARMLAEKAAALLAADANPLSAVSVDTLRATLDLAAGDHALALAKVHAALARCQRIHAPWMQIELRRLQGRIHAADGELVDAIAAYQIAILALEDYRGGVPRDEYMAAFLAGRASLYAEIVQLLVRVGDPELAFEYAERGKSRALVDLLAEQLKQSATTGRGGPFLRRIGHLRARLNAAYQRFFRTEGNERGTGPAADETGALEAEMARVLREARLDDREAVSLRAVDAPNASEMRRALEPDTALVEYMVAADTLYTFVVTRDSVRVVSRDVTASELQRLIKRFRFHIAQVDRLEVADPDALLRATRANLARLTGHLLTPVLDQLHARRLVVVPHGCLHGLPFHALPLGRDEWAADRYEIVYAPSAAVYRYCGERTAPAGGPACVFGLPDEAVPEIEREVRTVADALATDRLFLGDAATAERLRQEAADARLLHIATHGMFRRTHPMLSSIRLADGWLNLYDLYELDLNAELVVLSTCESGTAGVSDGDEILGLTRGFLYAGTRALLSSQWRVKDSVTATFMETFYRRLGECGDAATAIRETMAAIRAESPHPFHWAPFFLTGHPLRTHRNTEPRIAPVRNLVGCQ